MLLKQRTHNGDKNTHGIDIPQTPIYLVVLIGLTTFIAEAIVMLILAFLPPMPASTQAFLDGFLLILFLTPALYYFIYRPMRSQISALVQAQDQLQSEVTERKLAEEALRQSERDLRFLSSQLLSNQEKERQWLSRELHEELAQNLAAVSVRLRLIEQMIEKDQVPIKNNCEQNLGMIRQIIGSVRKLSGELAPVEIEHGSLEMAIRELVGRLTASSDIAVICQISELDALVPKEAQTTVYRIVQEAIANVEKHSSATRLSVIAEQQPGHISITVKDNGKGFDKDSVLMKATAERGLGLATMEERVRMLGGSLAIWSQEGQGTRITFTLE